MPPLGLLRHRRQRGVEVKIMRELMPKPKEKDIQRAILDYLALFPLKVFAWRANTGAMKVDRRFVRFNIQGAADITGVLVGGRRLEIEVKRPGWKPAMSGRRAEKEMPQRVFGECIKNLGGVYIVATSVDDLKVLGLEE